MYICLKCKEQFSDAVTRYGDCPYCGAVNMMAQNRKNLESDVLNKTSFMIKKLMCYIDKRKLGR